MIQFALNNEGDRVHIKDAIKGGVYMCEICGSHLLPKQGKIKEWHFAHENKKDCDSWHEMTEWHRNWQNKFSSNHQEIVIKNNGEIHRADIKTNTIVIEFQNSSMSVDEFEKRTLFYSKDHLLIWIINMQNRVRHPQWVYESHEYRRNGVFVLYDVGECLLFFNNPKDALWCDDFKNYEYCIKYKEAVPIHSLHDFLKHISKSKIITKSKYMIAEENELLIWEDRRQRLHISELRELVLRLQLKEKERENKLLAEVKRLGEIYRGEQIQFDK